jgi:hypothetical protein
MERQSSIPQSSKHIDQSNQPVSSSAKDEKPARERVSEQKNQHPPLREQIAEQPGAKKQPPVSVHMQAPEQVSKEHSGEDRPALKEQIAQIRPPSRPVPPAAPTMPEVPDTDSQSTDHELQGAPPERPHAVELPADLPSTPPLAEQKESQEEEPIEERPTQLMEFPSSTEEEHSQEEEKTPVEERPTQIIAKKALENSVEEAPTAPMLFNEQDSSQGMMAPRAESASILGRPQRPSAAPSAFQEGTRQPGAIPSGVAAPASHTASPRQARKRVSRKLIAAVLIVLVLIGGSIWTIVAQPFSIPAITQPQVGFNNDALHVALFYPNGWLYTVNPDQTTVLFHDSSNTAQMSIATTNANEDNLATYLQSQADHVGIATPKTLSPESFAGATWQSVQGTVQQKGANYTCTIFATVQGNRLVTIIQQAPLSTYNEEDNLVFAHMRASLKLS